MKAAPPGQSGDYRYRYFGGFRLVLAAMVMLQHFGADLAPASIAAALSPYAIGSMAVLAFFALSGFVITEAVDCVYRDRPGAFMTNRLLRIVPHFLLAVALSILAHAVFRAAGGVRLWRSQPTFPDDAFDPVNILLNFVGIVPMADRAIAYNFLDITWAVRVEMAFYLATFGCIAVGRRLSGRSGFAVIGSIATLLLAPMFYLAVRGHGIAMLAFVPYFTFGAGLYFATAGSRAGWLTAIVSVPAMLWQCNAQLHLPALNQGASLSVAGNLLVLIALLGTMTWLAFAKFTAARGADRWLGNLTYPLYLYHEDVLVGLLTFTVGYSYGVFAAGLVLSFLAAAGLMSAVDPIIGRYRDRVRGGSLAGENRPSAAAEAPVRHLGHTP